MQAYSVGGRSSATGAGGNVAGGVLWNPSTSRSLYVSQIAWAKTVATVDNPVLMRTTTRGTAGTTVTPIAMNDASNIATPRSGALLDLTHSSQPTFTSTTSSLFRWNLPASIGSGFILPLPDPIEIPAGTGLAIMTIAAVILQPGDCNFWWRE